MATSSSSLRVRVLEAEDNKFLFISPSTGVMEEIWARRPWLISDTTMVLKRWDGRGQPEDVVIDKGDFWLRVYNLPPTHRNADNMKKIGELFPKIIETSDAGLEGEDWTRYQKIMVEVDLQAPIRSGCKMLLDGVVEQISLKLEKILDKCDYCKTLGHQFRGCQWKQEEEIRRDELTRRKGKAIETEDVRRHQIGEEADSPPPGFARLPSQGTPRREMMLNSPTAMVLVIALSPKTLCGYRHLF
ncbi:hypothetical protein LINGRAHAP2_LOCUS10687 [Linum grandiflorum]